MRCTIARQGNVGVIPAIRLCLGMGSEGEIDGSSGLPSRRRLHTPTRRGALRDWPLRDLRGASALLRVAAEGGAEAILCGHVHDRFDDPPRPGRPRVICAGASAALGGEGYW